MGYADEGLGGLGWMALGGCAFVVGFVLAKLGVVTHSNCVRWATWISGIVSAVVAVAAADSASNIGDITALAGSLAVFAIVWLVLGLVVSIGMHIGVEKASGR